MHYIFGTTLFDTDDVVAACWKDGVYHVYLRSVTEPIKLFDHEVPRFLKIMGAALIDPPAAPVEEP